MNNILMLDNKSFTYKDEELTFKISKYGDSNEYAIQLFDSEHFPYACLTLNIPEVELNILGVELKENEIIVKTYSENEGLAKALRNSEWFRDTGQRISVEYVSGRLSGLQNFVPIEIWEVI